MLANDYHHVILYIGTHLDTVVVYCSRKFAKMGDFCLALPPLLTDLSQFGLAKLCVMWCTGCVSWF